jgi:TatD DNase family protein
MREFDRDRDEVIRRAAAAGVRRIVTVGTTLADCEKAAAIAAANPSVYAAIGIHPHEVKSIRKETYDRLKAISGSKKIVAYGEIGLDFFRNISPPDVQVTRFGEQLDLAKELALPIIIHDRDAHRETVSMLKESGIRSGIIHCFSGDYAMARECLDMGFYISIPGTVTFPKSERLREIVARVPLERLLVETDCPYLTPVPHRGKRNEPAFTAHTARRVAEVRKISFEETARATSENAARVFGL